MKSKNKSKVITEFVGRYNSLTERYERLAQSGSIDLSSFQYEFMHPNSFVVRFVEQARKVKGVKVSKYELNEIEFGLSDLEECFAQLENSARIINSHGQAYYRHRFLDLLQHRQASLETH